MIGVVIPLTLKALSKNWAIKGKEKKKSFQDLRLACSRGQKLCSHLGREGTEARHPPNTGYDVSYVCLIHIRLAFLAEFLELVLVCQVQPSRHGFVVGCDSTAAEVFAGCKHTKWDFGGKHRNFASLLGSIFFNTKTGRLQITHKVLLFWG